MSKLLSLYFILFYLAPFLLAATDGYWFEFLQITALVTAFFLGMYVINSITQKNSAINYSVTYIPSRSILTALAALYFLFSMDNILDVTNSIIGGTFTEDALQRTLDRYRNEDSIDRTSQIASILFYTYAFVFGAYLSQNKGKLLWLPLLIMIIMDLSALAKVGVLLALYGLATELIIRHNHKLERLTMLKYVKLLLLFVSVGVVIFIFANYQRLGESDRTYEVMLSKFMSYTIASHYNLLVWMSHQSEYFESFGYSSFTTFYKILGYEIIQGFYEPISTKYGDDNNVYTSIRGYLADFGLVGSCILFFVSGVLVKYFVVIRFSVIGYLFARMIIYMILFLFLSPFYFTTITVSFLLSWILIIQNRKYKITAL